MSDSKLRAALDNSQSLLAMFLLLGVDEDGVGIMPAVWQSEGLSKLLKEQLLENRRALSPSSQSAPVQRLDRVSEGERHG